MQILLLGYGKMGKTIETLALKAGHNIAGKIDESNTHSLSDYTSVNTDVAIEFSQPDAAYRNIEYCLQNSIPVVSGTTGWLDKKPHLDRLCLETGGAFFYASNYSIGVNLFFDVNKKLARLMNGFSNYKVSMEEIHHTEKKDEPSGTAITLAEDIIQEKEGIDQWVLGSGNRNDLPIESKREGKVPGTHIVTYSSAVDDIEIKHTAHSREGFASGALMVAQWILEKKGVLNMSDYLKSIF
ncbi:MAG: 4-hydroxy-tetrahydrodipicolinate reductase [Bacteroidota bacterium]